MQGKLLSVIMLTLLLMYNKMAVLLFEQAILACISFALNSENTSAQSYSVERKHCI